MSNSKLKSDLILLVAAMIWGFAFVAQRAGMNYVGPFTFNGVRFTLGAIVLIPFILKQNSRNQPTPGSHLSRELLWGSLATGVILFGAVSLQQVGLKTTTAGKAGFLTGLYVVFVPLLGLFFRQRSGMLIWIGILISMVGLYFLSVTSSFSIEYGDMLVLMCAVIFSGHVMMIGWLSPKMDPFLLAWIQFSVCAILSLSTAFISESVNINSILLASIPIGYGGLFSVGIAYTLQVIAQQKAHPAYASIILSMEAVFAAIGGWLILDEHLTGRSILGCLMMLGGMILVQLSPQKDFSVTDREI